MADKDMVKRAVEDAAARLKSTAFDQKAIQYKETKYLAAATQLRARMCTETGASRARAGGTEAAPGSQEEALLRAAESGDVQRVVLLLAINTDKPNVDATSPYGRTALHYASARADNGKIIEALLEAGADKEATDILGYTPLHAASGNNSDSAAELLIEAGASPEAKTKHGSTPLHEAAAKDSGKVATLLLKAGADQGLELLEATDKYGATPLMETAYKNSATVADILLKAGANQAVKDRHGRALLDVAAWNESEAVAELLRREAKQDD